MNKVIVIGAGLAGSECAWQLANHGFKVELYEMRPKVNSLAHHTDLFGELVCSNSLRAASLTNAVGLLKEELRLLNSLLMECADQTKVPAGGALAVDRHLFAKMITEKIKNHPNITVINEEVTDLNFSYPTVIASGPLTTGKLAESIKSLTGDEYLYFYDAAAPIVTKESIDFSKAYFASRYGKGDGEYINCPMNEEQYQRFYHELINAEVVPIKEFEKEIYFEGCMPIEEMARRGEKTLLFGPLKPVGLEHPETKETYHAVVQLRQDNKEGTLYNLVGFQTHLKWGEQKRVFRLIPGLEKAEFVRYGVMHRNTYINSPSLLNNKLQLKHNPNYYFAGQITGSEGYVEAIATGLAVAYSIIFDKSFPRETAIGSLTNYLSDSSIKNFQPMNINFGLFLPPEKKIKDKKQKYEYYKDRALETIINFTKSL
ncbi:methylenetetrahydrofolate--tRNA-(uracil(54)-C(5))-methyltransferase (FADH(2)-oxidizing) TrmFO [Anaerobranca gottschalkii]|uniref:Methylenetetrahydrofolate--tRNA-(uracil-5-)-methyltransferase TrmFO n=1 Tax=Anaerobranca gottschalkii DSM 13577 TaxID=1120990 RepID=A0A1H9ZFF0_9FIRM|nr:methylenetetrahydrofolate--tRNA-(uracil(54)-C(5))-methyltransferase (FADH(2)-oxidizing) TrmFO [Anaerobranca gottschalkii]SES79776.1 methylenetetrahydrofolate--tRNA-(uracil-5-)-methyltransferase [Anaerobranca gottschalkii DSM 13577]